MSTPLIEATHLHKRFAAFTALHDVNLHLNPGEVVGFLGPNGAGKSTTMKVLTGYVAATSGDAHIHGHDLNKDPLACRRAIGYLPQELPLYPEMTVQAYLDHAARLKGVARATRKRQVVEAMERASLLEVSKRHIHKLSGGNRQRVGLAQALIGQPPILILDEATAGLDPTQVARFRDLIRSLASDHGILLSTHILAEVEACCSRVVILRQGRDILHASIEELRERARSRSRLRVRLNTTITDTITTELAQKTWADDITTEHDAILLTCNNDARSELVQFAQAHSGLRELVEERRSLEDVFEDIIEQEAPVAVTAKAST